MNDAITKILDQARDAQRDLHLPEQMLALEQICKAVVSCYRAGGKVLVFGNGGSASDAQHLAAELVCRFAKNRAALAAIALTANTSTLTAVGNDFSFEDIFSRQVEALVKPGDVVIGISTSGNSANVIKALQKAHAAKAVTVTLTGERGGLVKGLSDICFCAPSSVTARIQECHILAIHILSAIVEDTLFGN